MDFAYAPVTVASLFAPLIKYSNGVISLSAVNAYFALREILAIREAAASVSGRWKAYFTVDEVAASIDRPRKEAFQTILELQVAGLIRFSEDMIEFKIPEIDSGILDLVAGKGRSASRIVPVPRTILRYLTNCRSFSRAAVLVGYLCRGLSLKQGKVKSSGSVKISWFVDLFGLSKRAVQYARRSLIGVGLISDDTGSCQRKLNRTGCYFTLNCLWREEGRRAGDSHLSKNHRNHSRDEVGAPPLQVEGESRSSLPPLDSKPSLEQVENSAHASHKEPEPATARPAATPATLPVESRCSAPPPPSDRREFAPPIKDRDLPIGRIKDQNPATTESGVSVSHRKGAEGTPSLKKVTLPDLQSFERTKALYEQAVATGLIPHSEQSLLQWIGAAIRAKSVRGGDSVRVFMGIVRRGLWGHITQEQEDRARRALRTYFHGSFQC